MGMSNAERQRKFCARRDEDETRRRKYLKDSKEKYKKDKTLGKRKQITDMTQREKRHQRKIWRVQKRKLKERRKAEQERILTPPSSPVTPEKRQKRQIDDKQMNPYDRKKEFITYLQKLAKCRTFCETECKQIDDKIGELTIDPHEVHILKEGVVHSDGNCLPSTGSVFAYSDTEHVEEMRVRIK
ncbi:hypothetical protein MAR_004975 [Mya arenaria]|uniref:Uncharacterized protein n=1 Tax=Mya arenaria TaxID=6604 RepID=A0ABY7EY44_MYAAR|nr:hypothetical protein MAR_004975 [Mya arenaria]